MKTIFVQSDKLNVPEVGDTVSKTVYCKGHELDRTLYKGKVIYMHPDNRYYTVEFGKKPNTYRESYMVVEDWVCQKNENCNLQNP